MKTLLTTILLLLASLATKAQSSYELKYDAAGNRTMRKVITLNPARKGVEETLVDKQGEFTFEISPNPTLGKLIIHTDENFQAKEDKKAKVFDINGNQVYGADIKEQDVSIDVSSMPTGTYIIKITAKDYLSDWKVVKM